MTSGGIPSSFQKKNADPGLTLPIAKLVPLVPPRSSRTCDHSAGRIEVRKPQVAVHGSLLN